MENVILSILLIKSATIYEIRMFIQRSLCVVCSDSLGSIQAAVKNLLGKNCIECHEFTQNNLFKREYSITAAGLVQFTDWIKSPMNISKIKNMEKGKFFFLGMASREVRISSITNYLVSLRDEKEKLLEIKKYVEITKDSAIQTNVERIQKDHNIEEYLLAVSGEKELCQVVSNIYDYQIYHLEYGLTSIEYDIKFYEEILSRECL